MFSFFILFIVFCASEGWICNFDNGEECIHGLRSASSILIDQTTEEIRQPPSDVTAILTSNDQGKCFFPYKIASFQMYFCKKSDPNSPATCPILNENGSKMNCSEGEYGYEVFEGEENGSRSYQLKSFSYLSIGDHCIDLFYYLSDGNSNGRIKVVIEDNQTNENKTILQASSYQNNKWHQIRQNFRTIHSNSKIFFIFERGLSNRKSFYIGIDQINITDTFCETIPTTTKQSFTTTMKTKNNTLFNNINSTNQSTTNIHPIAGSPLLINTPNNVISTSIYSSNNANSVGYTINSTPSMTNRISTMKNNSTITGINSTLISSISKSSSSKKRLSYQIALNIIFIIFILNINH